MIDESSVADAKPGVERDRAIREAFEPGIAEQLIGRASTDSVLDSPVEWSEQEEPHHVGAGFFIYADTRDWESGTIAGEVAYPETRDELHTFWDAEEHLVSQFARPEFAFELSQLSFRAESIELLVPNVDLNYPPAANVTATIREAAIGRPRKWDWEGAFAMLAVAAQHPDGLPTGHGAQAKIEKLLSEWFVSETGDSPATSQIRARASKMIRLLKSPTPNGQ